MPHLRILASLTVVTSDSKMFIGGLNWDTTDGIHPCNDNQVLFTDYYPMLSFL
ncbi:hypothetical protein BDR06DRAFT_958224 [Suillus hirtellus]|nr:hypothetical protein BDR06DRAFT_958224 [Suillus hirtellus]